MKRLIQPNLKNLPKVIVILVVTYSMSLRFYGGIKLDSFQLLLITSFQEFLAQNQLGVIDLKAVKISSNILS